jgi:4-hydroxy-3-polyprenylbenzoate decarboxylase
MKRRLVVAITGASGAVYGVRLLEVLLAAGCDVYLSISGAAQTVLQHELGVRVDLEKFCLSQLIPGPTAQLGVAPPGSAPADAPQQPSGTSDDASPAPGRLQYCHYMDFSAPIASGSLRTDGMVICPCSCGTLSAIVHGSSANLIHRTAEVHLKERRKLILVPRETPLSITHLDNMKRAAQSGAIILPAMPGFYHRPKSVGELVDFVVSRICDQLGVDNNLIRRWG